jgi:hypothetical protein
MIKYLELALSQEMYEYLEELDEMNWSARGNVLNQYLRNTSIGTTVKRLELAIMNVFMYLLVLIIGKSKALFVLREWFLIFGYTNSWTMTSLYTYNSVIYLYLGNLNELKDLGLHCLYNRRETRPFLS